MVLWWKRRQRPRSGSLQRNQPPTGCQTGHHHTRRSRYSTCAWLPSHWVAFHFFEKRYWKKPLFFTNKSWCFHFRRLLLWGGRSCLGSSYFRTLIALWYWHAADAKQGTFLLSNAHKWQRSLSARGVWWSGSFCCRRRKTVTTQTTTAGRESASGKWSRSRAWNWKQCLVLVTRASKTLETHATSAQWCRCSSVSQTSRECEYTVERQRLNKMAKEEIGELLLSGM